MENRFFLMLSVCVIMLSALAWAAQDSEIIFRPGPGLNDGTDQGGLNSGKDASGGDCNSHATNFGNTPTFGATPISNCNLCTSRGFIQFDISSLPDNVSHVYLGFTHIPHTYYCYSNCQTDFYFYPVTSPWDEMTVNLNNAPSHGSPVVGPIHISFPNDFGNREYEITELYRQWKNGTIPNYGIEISSPTVGCNNAAVGFYVYSSDEADESKRPYLRIIPTSTGSNCKERAFTSYEDTVLKAYIAYYGRPADVGGLQWWAAELEKHGGDLASIIDAFGNSAEFTERYGSLDAQSLVNNLYRQLFGRDAEPEGLSWWTDELQSGRRTLARIALDILYGAKGDDATVVENRLKVTHHYVTAAEELGDQAVQLSASSLSELISSVDATQASVEAACRKANTLLVDQGGGGGTAGAGAGFLLSALSAPGRFSQAASVLVSTIQEGSLDSAVAAIAALNGAPMITKTADGYKFDFGAGHTYSNGTTVSGSMNVALIQHQSGTSSYDSSRTAVAGMYRLDLNNLKINGISAPDKQVNIDLKAEVIGGGAFDAAFKAEGDAGSRGGAVFDTRRCPQYPLAGYIKVGDDIVNFNPDCSGSYTAGGNDIPTLDSVTPNEIAATNDHTSITLHGKNLWPPYIYDHAGGIDADYYYRCHIRLAGYWSLDSRVTEWTSDSITLDFPPMRKGTYEIYLEAPWANWDKIYYDSANKVTLTVK